MRAVHDETQSRAPRVGPKVEPLPEFFDAAICKDYPAQLWDWRVSGENHAQRIKRLELGIAVCSQCPLAKKCRTFALEQNWANGVWGGLVITPRRDNAPGLEIDHCKGGSDRRAVSA